MSVFRWLRAVLLVSFVLGFAGLAHAQVGAEAREADAGFESIREDLANQGLDKEQIIELHHKLGDRSFVRKLKPEPDGPFGIDLHPLWDYDIDWMVYLYRQMKYVACLQENIVKGMDPVEQTLHHLRVCGKPPERPFSFWKAVPMPLPIPIWPEPWIQTLPWKGGGANIELLENSNPGQAQVIPVSFGKSAQTAPSRK